MNRLAPAPDDQDLAGSGDDEPFGPDAESYLLPRHAHIVVYERKDGIDGEGDEPTSRGDAVDAGSRQLVTIYDCGAAQKPPSAQLLGELGSVRAACETTENPTGYVLSMREPAVLVDEGDGHYVVRPR